MKNTYLIFPNPNDVYYNAVIICTKEELNSTLIENEMMNEGDVVENMSWIIFENGNMIQG
jgi:hypothetical protein